MSDYEVIFGLDCVGGDQAPVDCAVVKTSDGKPGIMLDGEVFTKDSLTPAVNKLPLVVGGEEVGITEDDLAGITRVREYAFYQYTGLKSIDIPNTIRSIGGWSFYGCTGLTSITIGDGVYFIGQSAFYGCSGLTSVTIPDSVTRIIYGAFENCSGLASITIPANVTEIGADSFKGCDSMTSFRILATTPPEARRIFGGSSSSGTTMPPCLIYVPEESVDVYKEATGWSDYAAYIEADPNS